MSNGDRKETGMPVGAIHYGFLNAPIDLQYVTPLLVHAHVRDVLGEEGTCTL